MSATCRSRITTRIAPSPSTRARKSVLIVRRSAMGVTRGAERLRGRVEGAEGAAGVASVRAELQPLARQGDRVRALHRPEAAVAASVVGRAERAAAGVRDRAEAGRP